MVDWVKVEVDDVSDRRNDCIGLENKLGLQIADVDVEHVARANSAGSGR